MQCLDRVKAETSYLFFFCSSFSFSSECRFSMISTTFSFCPGIEISLEEMLEPRPNIFVDVSPVVLSQHWSLIDWFSIFLCFSLHVVPFDECFKILFFLIDIL